ncbi:hypothetical protein Dda_5563 [Drechslerella dactyloides]|uniref:Uncharacterized protein n=1 Tax=Drechslerella dactyloides TaxID=74499 RepID=A0AAD6IWE2_DREDA|nr:hypothetical protein Dda_5563 [Drechslerella dactyloides]
MSKYETRPWTYRMTNIPAGLGNRDYIQLFLEHHVLIPEEKSAISIVEITVATDCVDNKKTVGLVTVNGGVPEKFLPLWVTEPGKDGPRSFVSIYFGGGALDHYDFDLDFQGLTPIYQPSNYILADIVAVTGLEGHAYASWKGKENHHMWLRHYLPAEHNELKACRTMTYGWKSKLYFENMCTWAGRFYNQKSYRNRFLTELNKMMGSRSHMNAPLIFIGHSYGGILIMDALIHASRHPEEYGNIFEQTVGFLFFAVPYDGMYIEDIKACIPPGSSSDLLDKLDCTKSERGILRRITDKFIKLVDEAGIQVQTFRETEPTRQLTRSVDGILRRNGDKMMIIDEKSSSLGLPFNGERVIEADGKDHSNIVKFDRMLDMTYTSARDSLLRILVACRRRRLDAELAAAERLTDFVGLENMFSRARSETTNLEWNLSRLSYQATSPDPRLEPSLRASFNELFKTGSIIYPDRSGNSIPDSSRYNDRAQEQERATLASTASFKTAAEDWEAGSQISRSVTDAGSEVEATRRLQIASLVPPTPFDTDDSVSPLSVVSARTNDNMRARQPKQPQWPLDQYWCLGVLLSWFEIFALSSTSVLANYSQTYPNTFFLPAISHNVTDAESSCVSDIPHDRHLNMDAWVAYSVPTVSRLLLERAFGLGVDQTVALEWEQAMPTSGQASAEVASSSIKS